MSTLHWFLVGSACAALGFFTTALCNIARDRNRNEEQFGGTNTRHRVLHGKQADPLFWRPKLRPFASTRHPKPVMVIDKGKSRLLHEAKYDAFYGSQGPLPESMRILLCLLDGAERRHSLRMRWSGQARAPAIGRGRKSRESFLRRLYQRQPV
jgi:hypothetical protein